MAFSFLFKGHAWQLLPRPCRWYGTVFVGIMGARLEYQNQFKGGIDYRQKEDQSPPATIIHVVKSFRDEYGQFEICVHGETNFDNVVCGLLLMGKQKG